MRDLDPDVVGEGVDDGDADAVEAAGGLVGLAGELAARVERAEDDLERGLAGELRVRVDGDAAAVVADGDGVVGVKLDLDAVGVAGDGFVHRVVEDFGHEVVERAFVGAADVHAGALADGLEALEHLDRGGVVGGIAALREEIVRHAARLLFVGDALDHRGLGSATGARWKRCGGRRGFVKPDRTMMRACSDSIHLGVRAG